MKNNQEIQRINNLLPAYSAVFKHKITPIIDERIDEHQPVLPEGTITYGGNVSGDEIFTKLNQDNAGKVFNITSNITVTEENKASFVEDLEIGTVIKTGSNLIVTTEIAEEATAYKLDLFSAQQVPILYIIPGTEMTEAKNISPKQIVSWTAWGNFRIMEDQYSNCDISDFVLCRLTPEEKTKFENRPEIFLPEGVSEVMVSEIYVWIIIS